MSEQYKNEQERLNRDSEDEEDSELDDSDDSLDSQEKIEKKEQKLEKMEEDMELNQIKNQVEYFGYVMEPLNMKNDKGRSNMDKTGNFFYDTKNTVSDPWLDTIDNQDKEMINKMLKNRKQKGVHSDEENSGEEDENNDELNGDPQKKTKIEKQKQQNLMKDRFMNAPLFMLKQKLSQLLDDKTNVNQMLNKLSQIFKEQAQKKPIGTFKKNIRKKDLLKLQEEQEKLQQQNSKYTEEEKQTAKSSFDMIVDMTDVILQKTGNPDIYTQTKEEIQQNLEQQMQGEISSEEELEDQKPYEESDDDSDDENQNIQKKDKKNKD
ncbi:hypothetical protein PPERSA_07664 [Pseudocohnilembus persalinus]|uniref:Uncharacterized protein n=1 Tax=Pseudocohnilembus persalinus TaxID=266149 RepID=A0A0V0QI90_PSEPJ|nr:hypothetical protein PPERSA_07664 [Pseudocohnilembus persalinus]|eukprot:KRX02019.1 hypothetical protein PPERSA_07664 [Pseudocohnilembus persalinus]